MTFKKIFLTLAIAFSVFSTTAWSMIKDSDDKEGITCRVKQTTLARFVNLEEPISTNKITTKPSLTAWESYLVSPIKSVIKMGYNVIDFAVHNPKKAIIIGLAYSLVVVDAACYCYCSVNGWTWYKSDNFCLKANSAECDKRCSQQAQVLYWKCTTDEL